MFVGRWRVANLLGIPIFVDVSWLIILGLLTFSLAQVFPKGLEATFPGDAQNLPAYDYWIMGLVSALAFFICILLHELGHAVVARARGMSIRGITLFMFGGVAELGEEPPSAGTEFFMAIAGPIVSLVLALAFWLVTIAGEQSDWPHPLVLMTLYLAFINGLVLAFNLIPAFPLDGGRVLRSILWGISGNLGKATRWASLSGQVFAWLLMGWGLVRLVAGDVLGGIWTGLIGLFLHRAAVSGYQQVLIRQALKGESVRHFMNTHPIVVPPSLDLRHWVEDFVYRYHRKAFPVASDGHLEGFINTQSLARFPRAEWEFHSVGEVMRHDLQPVTIGPDADALDALSQMQRTGSSRLLVTESERLLGVISLKDLLRFLSLKMDLNGAEAEESAEEQTPEDREE